jgi:hypothetical protein
MVRRGGRWHRPGMRESGQSVVEWLAVLAGVVTLAGAAAVAMPSVAPAISGAMQTAICRVTDGSCGDEPARSATRVLPAPTASPRPTTPAPAAPVASPPAATPAPADPTRDLCGSSYFNAPELWFTSACAGHDRCYGAHRGKAACDTAFLNDMLATYATVGASPAGGVNSGISRASCRAAAHLYYKAVVIGGGFSYCHRAVCREE